MYIKRNYPFWDMMKWTSMDIFKFTIISIIPVFLYTVVDLKFLHLPWLPIALVGTAVAFLVSFKNNASYDRLWEARKIWGGIVNTSRSFSLMVNDFITNERATDKKSPEDLQRIKKEIINRHVAWMTAHRYILRQNKPWENFLENKSNAKHSRLYYIHEHRHPFEEVIPNYLSEAEIKGLDGKKNNATQILALQSKYLRKLKEEGLIWEFAHLEMQALLTEMFTLQGKNERIKNFPYPRQFATLNIFFVWIFIFFLPFGVMQEFDKIGQTLMPIMHDSWHLIAHNFVWFSVPFSVIISWVFHTMEKIGEASENPFEGTANDIPITSMARGIEIDILQVIGETEVPDPIPILHDIQM